MGRRGFTLLEVMLVVAIIGVVVALAVSSTGRSQDRARVSEAARHFRSRVEHARTLALAAGPRLGTPMFRNCAIGAGPVGNQLAIAIDPANGRYQLPTNLVLSPGGDFLDSVCQTFDLASVGEGNNTARVTVDGGPTPTIFGFTANGRLEPSLAAGPVFVRFESLIHTADAERGHGIRILRSGVVCTASGVAATGCSEDFQ